MPQFFFTLYEDMNFCITNQAQCLQKHIKFTLCKIRTHLKYIS